MRKGRNDCICTYYTMSFRSLCLLVLLHASVMLTRSLLQTTFLLYDLITPPIVSLGNASLADFQMTVDNIVTPSQTTQHISKQYTRYNRKKTKLVMKPIHAVHRSDLIDLSDDYYVSRKTDSANHQSKSPILRLLRQAGVTQVDDETIALLPSWDVVQRLYGNIAEDQPLYLAGYETCSQFRNRVRPHDAMIGTAGLFNSGTNAMTYYLRANLRIGSENKTMRHNGILTQVPWDKHYLPSLRNNHTAKNMKSVVKEHVLPIVVIRDPFTWVQSMCTTPYMVQFSGKSDFNSTVQRNQHCALPHVMNESSYVTIPAMTNRTWPSLFHLWNDWYNEYLHCTPDQPFLMVRFEDMLFRPRNVINQIRQCVGASWIEENTFTYVVDHSKWEHIRFHGPQSNLISAIIKHSNPSRRRKGMTDRDLQMAKEILDPALMKTFGYGFPDD